MHADGLLRCRLEAVGDDGDGGVEGGGAGALAEGLPVGATGGEGGDDEDGGEDEFHAVRGKR